MISRAVSFLLCLFLVACCCAETPAQVLETVNPFPKSNRQADVLREAAELFEEGKTNECLNLMKAERAKDQTLPPANFLLSKLFLAKNQSDAARNALEQAVVEDPTYPGTYIAFGLLNLREARWTDAALEFEQAAETIDSHKSVGEPDAKAFRQQYLLGTAAVAEHRGDWSRAKEQLTAWLAIQPDDIVSRQRLARAEFNLDDPKAAFENLKTASKAQGDRQAEPPAVSMLRFYSSSGNQTKAQEWLDYALNEDPDSLRVQLAAAGWLIDRGRADEASKYAQAAAKTDPDSREVRLVLGMVARHRKQLLEAERLFQEAHTDAPGDFMASNQLALVLADQNDVAKHNRALQLAEINMRQDPRNPEALATAGWVNFRLKKYDVAQQYLNAAVAGGRASAEMVYYIAKLRAEQGRLDEVRTLLEQAIDSDGNFVYRDEAKSWLESLPKKSAPTNPPTPETRS